MRLMALQMEEMEANTCANNLKLLVNRVAEASFKIWSIGRNIVHRATRRERGLVHATTSII